MTYSVLSCELSVEAKYGTSHLRFMEGHSAKENKNYLNWFAVKLLYEFIISGDPTPGLVDANFTNNHKTLEESIILVKAETAEDAYLIAEEKAREAEVDYHNPYDQLVQYRFVEAVDCFILIDDVIDIGTELYSRYLHVPKYVQTKEFIAKHYPETIDEPVDYNFVLRNRDFNR